MIRGATIPPVMPVPMAMPIPIPPMMGRPMMPGYMPVPMQPGPMAFGQPRFQPPMQPRPPPIQPQYGFQQQQPGQPEYQQPPMVSRANEHSPAGFHSSRQHIISPRSAPPGPAFPTLFNNPQYRSSQQDSRRPSQSRSPPMRPSDAFAQNRYDMQPNQMPHSDQGPTSPMQPIPVARPTGPRRHSSRDNGPGQVPFPLANQAGGSGPQHNQWLGRYPSGGGPSLGQEGRYPTEVPRPPRWSRSAPEEQSWNWARRFGRSGGESGEPSRNAEGDRRLRGGAEGKRLFKAVFGKRDRGGRKEAEREREREILAQSGSEGWYR